MALITSDTGKLHFKLIYPLSDYGAGENYNWWKQVRRNARPTAFTCSIAF